MRAGRLVIRKGKVRRSKRIFCNCTGINFFGIIFVWRCRECSLHDKWED